MKGYGGWGGISTQLMKSMWPAAMSAAYYGQAALQKRRRYNKKGGYQTYRKRRQPYGKKKTRRRKKRRTKRATSAACCPKLRSDIRTLKRRVESGMGTYIYKERDSGTIKCSVNGIDYQGIDASNITKLEEVIDNLPVFNPSSPATFTFMDFTAGTQQKEVEFASSFYQLTLKNNYDAPVRVSIYKCRPKGETSITAKNAVIAGLVDLGSSLTEKTPMLSPLDSIQFKDLYMTQVFKRKLLAGQTLSVKDFVGSFQYDPSFTDSHALAYQPRYGGLTYLVRVEGELAHDSVAAEYGNLGGGVDYTNFRKHIVKYDAGADIKFIEVVDGNDSFTNGGVVSSVDLDKETFTTN